jgi:hypothetical protein
MKKIAYLILAHYDPEHLYNLIEVLNRYGDIYIHLDKKSDINDFSNCLKYSNVIFIQQRVSVTWGGISMVDAQNLLIKEVLINKDKYSRCVFLSGSCYPIKSMNVITNSFHVEKKELIKFIDMRKSKDHYMKHVKKKWFIEPILKGETKFIFYFNKLTQDLLNLLPIKNKWNDNVIPYFGSQWISLTIDCCEYVINFQSSNPWFRTMNENTFSPDEHYYHTIIGNSYFAENSFGECEFEGRGTFRLANYHIIDSTLSKWFTQSDWRLIENSDKFFVRKVTSTKSFKLIKKINDNLLFK